MARLIWTQEATTALREIYDHIARDRPVTAARTIESIINKVEALTTDPTKGRAYRHARGAEVRLLHYGQFQVAYHVADTGLVAVLAVFHGLIFLPLQ